MTAPLVTVGIPCFNSAPSLRGAIESALAQAGPAVEVIVADDGSTDASLEIAAAFGNRITLLHNEHRGANHARSEIAARTRGEWLQFLDADDYLLPGKIARQLAEAGDGVDADVIYSPVWIETSGPDGAAATREKSTLDASRDLFSQWLSWELPQTGGCLWRRSALAAVGGWRLDQPCCQEHELYLRALQAGLRFQFAPEPGAVYRLWSESTLCRKDPALVIRTKTKLMDDLHRWLRERGGWTAEHQRIAGRACFEMARTLAKSSLADATAYYRERRRSGMIALSGPAAPFTYRAVHALAGFPAAERFARVLQTVRRHA